MNYTRILSLTRSQKLVTLTLMKQYFEDETVRADVERKAQVIGYARMMRRTIRRNGLNTPDGQELIALCKQRLNELLPLVDRLYY